MSEELEAVDDEMPALVPCWPPVDERSSGNEGEVEEKQPDVSSTSNSCASCCFGLYLEDYWMKAWPLGAQPPLEVFCLSCIAEEEGEEGEPVMCPYCD